MEDRVKVVMAKWAEEGDEAAHRLCHDLRTEIAESMKELQIQDTALKALMAHLESVGIAIKGTPAQTLDVIEPAERPRVILETAMDVYYTKLPEGQYLKTADVLKGLTSRGLDLGVQQPMPVIATVLANSDGFRRVARNTFKYRGINPD